MSEKQSAARPESVDMLDIHAGLVAHALILSTGSEFSATESIQCDAGKIATLAYDMAQAMMAERARRRNDESGRNEQPTT